VNNSITGSLLLISVTLGKQIFKMKTNHFCSSGVRYNRLSILLCSLALLLGGIIYVLFRASEPVFFKWIPGLASDRWFNFVRHISLSFSQFLPDWIVFSLPNGLWAFAYALLITSIWAGSHSLLRTFWMASIPLLVIGYEFLQYVGIIPGTFCIQDVALGMTGIITGIIVGTKTIKPKNHEKAFE
jgi:hypothetical protein